MTEKENNTKNYTIINNNNKRPRNLDSGLIYESDFNTGCRTYPSDIAERIAASWRRDMKYEEQYDLRGRKI